MRARSGTLIIAACALVLLSACESPTGTGIGDGITGRERIGWDQQAGDRAELAAFQYALYVDGARSVLTGAACEESAGPAGFGCSAALPGLSPGVRVLELATFVVRDGTVLESARSAPLRVTVAARQIAGSTPGGSQIAGSAALSEGVSADREGVPASGGEHARAPAPGTLVTRDGVRLLTEVLATGLTAPSDFALAGDGRVFVAERDGRIVSFDREGGRREIALALDDVDTSGGGGLLSIALHPDFDRTRVVFLVYTTLDRAGARTFELARYREAGGRLGERVVLLDGIPASQSAASSIRFGPDRMLYAAFDDGGEPGAAESLGSFNGKILRMTAEGALPDDNPLPSLVYSIGHSAPRGFDWQPGAGSMWTVGQTPGARDEVSRVRPGAAPDARWLLSRDVQPGAAGAAFYGADAIAAFTGNLFVAASEGAHLLRLVFDASERHRLSARERLVVGRFGRIQQVVAARDGALYFCTNNARDRGAGSDMIVRVRRAP
jgi:aldose sugar dehydrogenase